MAEKTQEEKLELAVTQLTQLINIVEISEKSAVANCRDSNMTHRLKQVIATLESEEGLPADLQKDVDWLREFLSGQPQMAPRFALITGRLMKHVEKKNAKKK